MAEKKPQIDVVNDGSFGDLPPPLYGTSIENARPGRSIEELQADPTVKPVDYPPTLPADEAFPAPIPLDEIDAYLASLGITPGPGGTGAYVIPITSRDRRVALERTAGIVRPPAPE